MKKPSTDRKRTSRLPREVNQLTESELATIIGGQGVDTNLPPHGPPKG